jgi:hypothetical protein
MTGNKKADLRRLFYCLRLNYLAAGAGAAAGASAAGAAAAGAEAASAAGAAAGAEAGLSQAVRARANRAAIRAERVIINFPLSQRLQNSQI